MGRKTDVNANSAFTSATSKSSGKSLRAVQVAAQRGEVLGTDLHRIAGTSLDKTTQGEMVTAAEIEVGNCDDSGEIISGSDWRKGVEACRERMAVKRETG